MSSECVRPMTNRSDTLPKEQAKQILLNGSVFNCYSSIVFSYAI